MYTSGEVIEVYADHTKNSSVMNEQTQRKKKQKKNNNIEKEFFV